MYAILVLLTLLSFTQSNPIAGNCISGKSQVSDHDSIPSVHKADLAAPKILPLSKDTPR